MSQLVTGDAVLLHLRPARIASRILARSIDLGIELVALWVVGQVLAFGIVADPDVGFAIGLVVVVTFIVGYPVAFETLWRGLTPGKAAMGLRVVRDDGGPIRFRHALTRGLLNLVDLWLTFATVGVITSLLSRRGKRVGDVVAGTFVVQERVPRQHVTPVFMPPQLAAWAATLDLSRLPDDLALAVRSFLGRASELRPEARERLGAELAAAVGSCVTPPPPQATPGWAYLAAVVAERRRRDEARMPARTAGPGWGGAPPGPSPWQPPPPTPGWGGTPGGAGAYGAGGAGTGAGGSGAGGAGTGAGGPGAGGAGAGAGYGPSPWGASAPPTGAPPPVGPPPPVGTPPPDPGPPRLPSAPSPQWGPAPVPPSPPPATPAAVPAGGAPGDPAARPARRRRAGAVATGDEPPPAAPAGGFAVPD